MKTLPFLKVTLDAGWGSGTARALRPMRRQSAAAPARIELAFICLLASAFSQAFRPSPAYHAIPGPAKPSLEPVRIGFSWPDTVSTISRTGHPMRSQRISARFLFRSGCFFVLLLAAVMAAVAQGTPSAAPTNAAPDRLKNLEESLEFIQQELAKQISDLMWFQRLQDIAEVDKVRFTGPPPRVTNNPTGQGAGNE